MMIKRVFIILFSFTALFGCESTYYAAMEKVGQHKRDILVDRVESASEAQEEAQAEFKDALTHLSLLINFDGGNLAQQYELSQSHFDASKSAANEVSNKIQAIENVAEALFEEWQEEIDLYSSASLKAQSQAKLASTQRQYSSLLKAMYAAEKRMSPVLAALQDNVLFLKHNLNAKAIGAIQGEYQTIKRDIERLINDMNVAIKQSNNFVQQITE
jgi:hypothetical protein